MCCLDAARDKKKVRKTGCTLTKTELLDIKTDKQKASKTDIHTETKAQTGREKENDTGI